MPATVRSLSYLDPAGRCEALATIWPGIEGVVIDKFNNLWDKNEVYKRRFRSRQRAFQSLSAQALPAPLYLGWEREIFEVCLQTVLSDLPLELWRRGEPSNEVIREAAEMAIPDVRMDIAIELSRCSRPALPRPREVSDETTDQVMAIDDTGELDGWYRIGYQEEELLNEDFWKEQEVEYAHACVGLCAVENDDEINDVKIPFAALEVTDCWRNIDPEPAYLLSCLRGGVVGASGYTGFTTRLMVLACHPIASAAMELQSDLRLGPLRMLDQEGKPAVVFRTWKSEAIDAEIAGCVHRLRGCDLLMRPDCFAALSQGLECGLIMVQRSGRH